MSGHIGLWYHPTVTAQWLDDVVPGWAGDPRTEARPVHFCLSILFTRTTASTDIVAINADGSGLAACIVKNVRKYSGT